MFRSDAGIHGAADLHGKTICVTAGTTNPNVFGDYLASIATLIVDTVRIETVTDDTRALQLLHDGVCHGFVNDDSVVAGYVSIVAPPAGVTYSLASWSGTPFARAPFSAVSLDGDAEFASVVDWFVNGLFLAEMYDVTQANADAKAADPSLPGEAQRLLGAQLVGGHKLEFDMLAAIKAIGNYAEVYERNFGSFLPRSRANMLYQNGGAVFPGGFR
jgi:general L-amino acid transport system substrate-binding protein